MKMRPLYIPNVWWDDNSLYKLECLRRLKEEVPWINKDNAPRNECFMASNADLTYSYGKNPSERVYKAEPLHSLVKNWMFRLNLMFETNYNVCVLNYYLNEKNHLGWHADDSPEQDLTHPICVLSFGAERFIYVKEKSFKGDIPEQDRFLLKAGSLFVMPGGYQDNHFHKIPKHDRPCGPRISLTYRKLDR